MAKISIVIVDDEVLVRQGIKSYIESAGENMEIAGTFSNAKDAIDFLQNNSVQVLITDIKMAQMSGVDLIRHCVQCLYPMGIIVLSCYDNFEYARETFALGADAYILKDEVTQTQLIAEIKKTYTRLRSTAVGHGAVAERGSTDAKQYPNTPCVVAKIGFRLKYEQFTPVKRSADSEIVFDVASEIVQSNSLGLLLNLNGDMVLCIEKGPDVNVTSRKLTLAAKQLYENMLNYFNERVYLSVSDLQADQDFRDAVNHAAGAADQAFYDTASTLFVRPAGGAAMEESNVAFFARLIEMPSQEWHERFRKDLDAYFAWARATVYPPKKLINNMHGFLYKLEDHLLTYYKATFADIHPRSGAINCDYLDAMDNCDTVRDYVLLIVDHAIQYVNGLKACDAAFQRIVEYIDNHYASPISLATLAETFHLNASYLCKLFKDRMNKSFVSYLNQVRIDHAKQLLNGARFSLEEIAEKTGFNNSNYLVRVFKRTTGQTIGEYRRN